MPNTEVLQALVWILAYHNLYIHRIEVKSRSADMQGGNNTDEMKNRIPKNYN